MRQTLALFALSLPAVCATVPKQVTFHKDVVPVLQKRCQECHRPGEAAPMSFVTYKDARPWAKAIREAVASGKTVREIALACGLLSDERLNALLDPRRMTLPGLPD